MLLLPLRFARLLFVLAGLVWFSSGCSSSTRRGRTDITAPVTASPTETATARPAVARPIKPKLYLEHSGSMRGYDGPQVDGNFRNTIIALLNTFPNPNAVMVSIVNDKVYPYPKSFADLIKSGNLFQTRVGNPAYTDFEQIFKTVVAELDPDELAILTTDLIYSDKGTSGQIAARVTATARSLAQLALKPYARDGALLVLQLHSEFRGSYYPFNQPNKGVPYRGNRPYYVLFFAKNDTMDRLLTDPAYVGLRDFGRYPGFDNVLLFSNSQQTQTPFYTLDEFDADARGTFDKDRDRTLNKNGIHAIKNVKPPRRATDRLTLVVAATLPATYGAAALLDTKNYVVGSLQDGFRLKAVRPATARTDGATHRLLLEATRPGGGDRTVTIRLKRNFPPNWLKASSSDNDTRPDPNTGFARQTFGLLPLLTGVREAYDAHTTNKNDLFTLTLSLKD
jgi:hypothetical protein